MNEEAQLLLTLWEKVQDHVANSHKAELSETIVRLLVEYGMDIRLLHDAEGEDTHLDNALMNVSEDEAEPDPYGELEEDGEY